MDGGNTWRLSPREGNQVWQVLVLVLSGKEIVVRAWDETQNTQPEKLVWNGMVHSCVLLFFE